MASYFTDDQIRYLIEAKESGRSWSEIVIEYNEQFPESRRTYNSLETAYRKYKDIGTSDAHYVSSLTKNYGLQKRSAVLAKENRELAGSLYNENELKNIFAEYIKNTKIKFHRPLKKIPKKSKTNRILLAHLSDTHFGAIVDREELNDVNEYNQKVACRRIAYFCKNLVTYKADKRKETELVLVLNGDIIAGIIHSTDFGVELLSKQFVISLSILSQAISYLAKNFKSVKIYASSGNHDRMVHKGKDRATIHKWDSYATMIFYALKEKFRDYKNVDMFIPKCPYLSFNIFNHKVFATHSDTVVKLGNTSKSVPLDGIINQINRINNSTLAKEGKFNIFLLAHVHSILSTITNNGEFVFINGSVVGTDQFAQSIGIFSSNPAQQFVEITKEHVGDMRFVSLKEADNKEELDSIVEEIKI